MTDCASRFEAAEGRRVGRARCAVLALVAFIPPALAAQRLSPLAPAPDWSRLDAWHETITADELRRLLATVYAPADAWRASLEVSPGRAIIRTALEPPAFAILRLARSSDGLRSCPRYWRPAASLGPAPAGKPLAGLRVAIDPGHLGGRYARVEERWFKIDDAAPVTEGDLTLLVARLLKPRLETLGAEVVLVRDSARPLTRLRPERLMSRARASLADMGVVPVRERHRGATDALRGRTVQYEAERLFYRVAEIRARAALINDSIRPDLVLCLHFNAEPWGDPSAPVLVDGSHVHCLVNGCYGPTELSYDDERFGMLIKLLGRTHAEELALNRAVAGALARAADLPPYVYHPGPNVRRLDTFVWARNLLANRLYECPVVYAEPYVMNSRSDHARIQAGDYDGQRDIDGRERPSIFREYADALARGLAAHYAAARRRASPP